MTPDILEQLSKFTYVIELWDQVSPGREDLVGLVKIPLASFCISMRTTDTNVFSLNFLADQHCYYPMIVCDDNLPIVSILSGETVGFMKLTLAMGSAVQINR